MADSYTTRFRLIQMVNGSDDGTWGTNCNSTFSMTDEALGARESISVTSGNVTLTTANNATDQGRKPRLLFTGSPGATRTITFPDVEAHKWVYNGTSDASSLTLKSGVGTTVTLKSGYWALIETDGATNTAAILNTGNTLASQVTCVIGDGSFAITTGSKGYFPVEFDGTITMGTLLADQTGSISIEVRKTTYSSFDSGSTHPVTGDKISASAPLAISSAKKYQDSTLTGWTTSVSQGDILEFYVNSASTLTRVTASLRIAKLRTT